MKDIKYFPDYKDVFVDEKLKYYFKPICTIGNYHFLTIDGIFCIKDYKYSENYYFGFRLKDRKYEFLGNLDCFGDNDIEKLYEILEKEEYEDLEEVQEKLDEMTEKINDLQEEFDENDSEIETVARDSIGVTVEEILDYFGIDIDIEEAIRERDW